jgi:plastocyanin
LTAIDVNTSTASSALNTTRSMLHRLMCALCCTLSLLEPGVLQAAQLNTVVVGADGKPLVDAVVYLLSQREGITLPKPKDANIDQVAVSFVPAVSVLQTGTAVHFPNSDNIRHQVYSFSPAKIFNLKLYSGRPSAPVIFDKPGVVVLGCNIHDQMVAWVLVVDTTLFARTDAGGKLSIKNIPEGEYWLQAWHPGIQKPFEKQSLTFSATENVDKTLKLDAAPIAPVNHAAGH